MFPALRVVRLLPWPEWFLLLPVSSNRLTTRSTRFCLIPKSSATCSQPVSFDQIICCCCLLDPEVVVDDESLIGVNMCLLYTRRSWGFMQFFYACALPSHCSTSLAALVSLAVFVFLLFLILALLSLMFEFSSEEVFELKHAFKNENVFREPWKTIPPPPFTQSCEFENA